MPFRPDIDLLRPIKILASTIIEQIYSQMYLYFSKL